MMNIPRSMTIALYDAGMSQKELAVKMGVSCAYVSAICTGKKSPSLASLSHICSLFGIRASKFIALGEVDL